MSVITQILMQGAVDGQSLRDIKPPLALPQNLLPYFIGGVTIIGFVIASIWYWIQKRRQTAPIPVTTPEVAPRLAHEVAYEQLSVIEASDWLTRGDMEMYHTQIAHVLRTYISARYRIPALELTTTALLRAMLRAEIGKPYVARVEQLLANCDKVKFATYQPDPSEASARIADARRIVDETKPLAP